MSDWQSALESTRRTPRPWKSLTSKHLKLHGNLARQASEPQPRPHFYAPDLMSLDRSKSQPSSMSGSRQASPRDVSSCVLSSLDMRRQHSVDLPLEDPNSEWELVVEKTFLTCIRRDDSTARRPSSAPATPGRSPVTERWQSLASSPYMSTFSSQLPRGEPCPDELAFFCEGSQPSDDSTATCSSRDEVAVLREELDRMQKRCAELEAQVASSRAEEQCPMIAAPVHAAPEEQFSTMPEPVYAASQEQSSTTPVPVHAAPEEQSSAMAAPDLKAAAAAPDDRMSAPDASEVADSQDAAEDAVAQQCTAHAEGQEDTAAANGNGEATPDSTASPASKTARRNQRRRAAAKNAKEHSASETSTEPALFATSKATTESSLPQKGESKAKAKPKPKRSQADAADSTGGAVLHKSASCARDPIGTPVGTITREQLAECSGDCPRLLISVCGHIFDVSANRARYGPGGPNSWATGKDATWALLTGARNAENCNRFYDLKKAAPDGDLNIEASLGGWLSFFQQECGEPIGQLDVYEQERDLPQPPPLDENAECILQ